MGLLSALAGLPLAPLKGLVGLAKHIQQQAEQERQRELAELQVELLELQLLYDRQGVADEELIKKEAELLEKVGAVAGVGGEEQ
jgi:hypothetical protein